MSSVRKVCPHTKEVYTNKYQHRKTCIACNEDWKRGSFSFLNPDDAGEGLPTMGSADPISKPSSESPSKPRNISLDYEEPKVEAPTFLKAEKVAEQFVSPAYVTPDTLGLLFRAPIDMLTTAPEPGEFRRPNLTPDQEKLLVQVWIGPLNRALMALAGKKPELVIATMVTMVIYGPVLVQTLSYRSQLKHGHRRGDDTRQMKVEGSELRNTSRADFNKDAFAEKLRTSQGRMTHKDEKMKAPVVSNEEETGVSTKDDFDVMLKKAQRRGSD